MNQPLRFLIIGGLLIGLWACIDIRPIPLSLDSPTPLKPSPQPPGSTYKCPELEMKILGSWRCTTAHLLNTSPSGGSTNYSGRIILNADLTLSDPDTLLGYKIGDELVIRRAYQLIGDSLILFVADRLERQLGVPLNLQTNQCDTLKFFTTGSGGPIT